MRSFPVALIVAAFLLAGSPKVWAEASPGVAAYEAEDYAKALPLLQQEAEKGDAAAQTKLGLIYAKGLGVPKDVKRALPWFEKAAAQGYAEAEYCMGVTYDRGEVIPQDLPAAAAWYRKAGEKGFDKAQFNLGPMLYRGEGIEKDAEAAVEWLQKAAAQNAADAQFQLARIYLENEGIETNILSAKMWMGRAAAGNGNAKKGAEILNREFAEILQKEQILQLAGGDGSSAKDAISFPTVENTSDGVKAEHRVVRTFFAGWSWGPQSLHNGGEGRIYDVIEISKGGETREIYFDISNWFGKM